MAFSTIMSFAGKVLSAFGVDAQNVTGFTLSFNAGELPSLEVSKLATVDESETLLAEVETQRFHLVPIEEED